MIVGPGAHLPRDRDCAPGTIAYHRERGSDLEEAGSLALTAAQQYSVEIGFSAAVIDLGMRGRAITDLIRDSKRYYDFTVQMAD